MFTSLAHATFCNSSTGTGGACYPALTTAPFICVGGVNPNAWGQGGTTGVCTLDWYCHGRPSTPNNTPASGTIIPACHNALTCAASNCAPAPTPFTTDCGQNCAIVLPTKTFDFNVAMGGVNAKSYVCEVGLISLCPTCNQHYLTVAGSTVVPATTKIYTSQTFGPLDTPTSANLYLNDLYFDAAFYVKYCVDVKRLVVGDDTDPTHLVNYDANISAAYTVTTGNYLGNNDYAGTIGGAEGIAKLGFSVFKDCSGALLAQNGILGGNISVANQVGTTIPLVSTTGLKTAITPDGLLELCGDAGCETKRCVYTLAFNETATCYRPTKCDAAGNCVPYSSTIHTAFDASVNFDCITDGTCSSI